MEKKRKKPSRMYRKISSALRAKNEEKFKSLLAKLRPYDQAQFFVAQKSPIRRWVYEYLSPFELAKLFADVELRDREFYILEMDDQYVADLLTAMDPDDAVDTLGELEGKHISRYLSLVGDETEYRLRDLLEHGEETAGSIMTTDFVVIYERDTVESSVERIKRSEKTTATIYDVFVVDEEERLLGIVSLRDLLVSSPETSVCDIIDRRVISVLVGAHQEKAARKIQDYDLLALPVVDTKDHMLGIITVDDVVDVLDQAAAEDYAKLAAAPDGDITDSPLTSAKKRLPWLVILLFLGMVTATLIGHFETTIEKVAILGAFIPVIAGTTGNSGTQALAVVVRAIATGDMEKVTLRRHFLREGGAALLTSLVCGVVLASIIFIWKAHLLIGLVAGVSLAFAIFVGTLVGSLIPLLMHKAHIDPAVASGPMITTICDIISMGVYFSIATMFLSQLM